MAKLHSKEQGGYRPIPLKGFRPPQPPDNWPYNGYPTTPNDPEYGIKNPKFERHIFIRSDQIFFDIDSQLGMVAKARRTADGKEDESISDATTTFRSMFVRWIDTYIGKAKTIMSTIVLEKFRETEMNSIKDNDEVDIALLVPDWYDDTTFKQLCDAVHNYIVNGTLREYFTLTLTSKDPVSADKNTMMAEGESEIRKLANFSKPGSIRKTQNPF